MVRKNIQFGFPNWQSNQEIIGTGFNIWRVKRQKPRSKICKTFQNKNGKPFWKHAYFLYYQPETDQLHITYEQSKNVEDTDASGRDEVVMEERPLVVVLKSY